MPIRPDQRHRYPSDWPMISKLVRERAEQKCEWCGVPNGEMIRRGTHRHGKPVWQIAGSVYNDVFCATTGFCLLGESADTCEFRSPPIKVVLTVAHLDHEPENVAISNLRALCQRCHLVYDAKHHARNRSATLRGRKAIGCLLDGVDE